MTKEQVWTAINDRLVGRWPARLREEGAVPIAVLAITQLGGPGYATPVVVAVEDITDQQLADFFELVSRDLRAQAGPQSGSGTISGA